MSHSFKFDGLNWWNTSDSWRCEGKKKKWIVSCQSIADFQQFAFVEKRSFFPRCLRFQGFLDLMDSHGIQYILLCFASFCFSSCDRWEKHEGKTNSGNFWQGQIAQYVFLVSAVIPATPPAAGFGRSLGGQQDPDESHSCSTLGVNWVPGPQDGGRDEERSRRRFPIHFGRRKGSWRVLGPQKSVSSKAWRLMVITSKVGVFLFMRKIAIFFVFLFMFLFKLLAGRHDGWWWEVWRLVCFCLWGRF